MEELCSTQLLALLHRGELGLGLAGAHLELLQPHCTEVLCKKHTTELQPNTTKLLPTRATGKRRHGSAATWLQKGNLGGNPHFSQMKEMYFGLFYWG